MTGLGRKGRAPLEGGKTRRGEVWGGGSELLPRERLSRVADGVFH